MSAGYADTGRTADILVAEIGSTVTKVNAFALTPHPQLLAHGEKPTTVQARDVNLGLQAAMTAIATFLGKKKSRVFEDIPMWASSSAAGGLRMTVHGLVYDMTVRAAREAALGAGAIIHLTTAGKLTSGELGRIKEISPGIILLTGGVEHGDKETVIHNAQLLAQLRLSTPVIYAGNSAARQEVSRAFNGLNQRLIIVDNVYPRLDELNIEPTRRVIQQIFEEHIIDAPGMHHITQMVTGKIMPTPGAVMEAAKLLAKEIGDLMVIDMGGATTDVHSVTEGSEEITRILIAPEPVAKRTVEGDLGLFVNAANVIKLIGRDVLVRELGFAIDDLLENPIPRSTKEKKLTLCLAREIVSVAVRRHAGRISYRYGPTGRIAIAEGKDLTKVKWIIGTGGFLSRQPEGKAILGSVRAKESQTELLPPAGAKILIDSDYIMSSAGVLADKYPAQALALLKQSLGLQ